MRRERRIVWALAVVVLVAVTFFRWYQGQWHGPPALKSDARILFSALTPREAPDLFDRYFTQKDLARVDTLPHGMELEREQLYGLPTSLLEEWMGYPGVRHWVDAGCGPDAPGTIIYNLEARSLTPQKEQTGFTGAIDRAIRMIKSTGCHEIGLAPGSLIMFGLDEAECDYVMGNSNMRDIDWTDVDLVDIQAQRFLSDRCMEKGGVARYRTVVSRVSKHLRFVNPDIQVFVQVSFRDNDPLSMLEGLHAVRDLVDGVYFSYPTNNPDIPCEYCTPEKLELFLSNVR